MGIDYDVPRALYQLIEGYMTANEIPYDPTKLHNSMPPGDFQPGCIISDVTPEVRKLIGNKHNFQPRAGGMTTFEITRGRAEEVLLATVRCLLKDHANFRNVNRWVFLIDTPTEVVAMKAGAHTKRQADSPPYTDAELARMGILVRKDSTLLVEDFGISSVWADDFERLWSTKLLKPVVGQFFAECLARALLNAAPSIGRGIEFVIEGAWPNQGAVVSWIGSKKPLAHCFVPFSQPTPGEADLKALSYLIPTFGREFFLRSDDGDFTGILLLYLLRLVLQGLSIDDLPSIWIDRTVNYLIDVNKSNPDRYVHITQLFRDIVCIKSITDLDSPIQVKKLVQIIVATVGLFLVRRSDFTEEFVNYYFKREDVDEEVKPALTTSNMTAASLITKVVRTGIQASKEKKPKPEKPKKRAPSYFSAHKLVTVLYNSTAWMESFDITYNRQTRLLLIEVYIPSMQESFERELGIDLKKYPCHNQHDLELNALRLETTLDYWANCLVKMDMVHKEQLNDSSILPYRFEALRRDPQTKISLHGFKLVPCQPHEIIENSTTQFYIDLDDHAIRKHCLKPNEAQSTYTVFKIG